jgi:hypothetical protein
VDQSNRYIGILKYENNTLLQKLENMVEMSKQRKCQLEHKTEVELKLRETIQRKDEEFADAKFDSKLIIEQLQEQVML